MMLWLLSFLTAFSASAMVPCGEHALERQHPSLVWKKFTDIQVRSRFADVDAVICVGKVASSSVAERVTYRDAQDMSQIGRAIEELENFQVLIRASDLPPEFRGIIRTGDLISLKIGAPTINEEARTTLYPVAVRFHRNVARGSANDVREIEFAAELDFDRDIPRPHRGGVFFDNLKMFISTLPPRMEQVVLKEGAHTRDSFFTSTLPRVTGLE